MDDLMMEVLEDLGRQLGEKAIDLARYRAHAQLLEVQLDEANDRIRELETLSQSLADEAHERLKDSDDV